MKVAPVIWQFGVDYPGAQGDDSKLPIRDVIIKAWDEVYWMAKFDRHAAAVSGPASIAKLVATYKAQGIGVYLWGVPKGRNVAAQLRLAKACLDVPGVKGLYLDVEPYAGFCNADCTYLADTFMAKLRGARPKAYLGVIYDPRSQHWARSGTTRWLRHATAAAPMCYWVTFAGQGVWAGAASSIHQAKLDLNGPLGFRGAYTPMLQGNASGSDLQQAAQQANTDKATLVTIWRRGVVSTQGWASLASVPKPVVAPAPPLPPADCSEVEAALAVCKVSLGTAQATVADRDRTILGLNRKVSEQGERIGILEGVVATLQDAVKVKDDRLAIVVPEANLWRTARAVFRALVSEHL
jgi:hypothetical protein